MIDVLNFCSEFCVVSSEHEQEDIRSQPSTDEIQNGQSVDQELENDHVPRTGEFEINQAGFMKRSGVWGKGTAFSYTIHYFSDGQFTMLENQDESTSELDDGESGDQEPMHLVVGKITGHWRVGWLDRRKSKKKRSMQARTATKLVCPLFFAFNNKHLMSHLQILLKTILET